MRYTKKMTNKDINNRIAELKQEIKDLNKRETELKREIKATQLKKVRRQKKLNKLEDRKEQIITGKRIRKQVVLNFRGTEPPYFFSIRAVTINPEINERGLKIAVMETLRSFVNSQDIDLSEFQTQYLGYEVVEVAKGEDTSLNNLRIHIEIMEKKKIVARYVR
jgi:hypothetical protein